MLRCKGLNIKEADDLKFRNMLVVFVLALMSIILVACGGSDDGANEDDGEESSGETAKVAIGPIGSESNNISKVMLAAHGLEEDSYDEYEEGFGDAAEFSTRWKS